MVERRHPLRFVWQMDADGRFVIGSDEFIELVGPRTMAAFGRLWSEIAGELKLDPENQVARAIATHETWSGITISCPMDETSERLAVELSGLPVFDAERKFRGYRGFGVCRDVSRINQLVRARRQRRIGMTPAAPSAPGVAAPQAAEPTERAERFPLGTAPASAKVVPFRPGTLAEPKAPSLSPVEHKAFRDLAQELTARLRTPQGAPSADGQGDHADHVEASSEASRASSELAETRPATPHLLSPAAADARQQAESRPAAESGATDAERHALGAAEPSLLDRVPVGVLVYRHDALIYANRRFLEWSGYESLDAIAAAGGLNVLFVEPSTGTLAQNGGTQSLSIMTRHGSKLAVNSRLFTVPWHGTPALALIVGSDQAGEQRRAGGFALDNAEAEIRKLKATLERDNRARETIEQELRGAKAEAQKAAATKADFLAKVSHEIRTPLNAITGFAEVIMAERFGPIGNERYREYLKDIHAAGTHLITLINDLLDLSKIESGLLNLAFTHIALNDLTSQCVSIMQPQANRARIIIRTALTPALPEIIADERSLRQIVLNLLANSIRFTGPGGQVIVSTACSESREVVLRVRDTGAGMSEKDVEAVLEPFRQTATSGSWGSGGAGFGLPLTKALAEANRANFNLKSAPNDGALVEISFPPSRVAAE